MPLSTPIFQLKRQAKSLSRDQGIPLNQALDRIARGQGYATWSLLAAKESEIVSRSDLLSSLNPGEMALLAARPGQGKTMMGLKLIAQAARAGRHGAFFTLEFNQADAQSRLQSVRAEGDAGEDSILIDTSDEISADYLIERLKDSPRGTLAVIDYLQLMDQNRATPPLADQIQSLSVFTKAAGVVLVFISQIDRAFDLSGKALPDLSDIRLPNPIDLSLFAAACFLHGENARIERIS